MNVVLKEEGRHLPASMAQCVQNCINCWRTCLETIPYCLSHGGKHAEAEHIQLMMNCVDICQTSASFMLTNSSHHNRTCSVCAEVCEDCANSCESFGDDDAMKECAVECRICAESCRRMAS